MPQFSLAPHTILHINAIQSTTSTLNITRMSPTVFITLSNGLQDLYYHCAQAQFAYYRLYPTQFITHTAPRHDLAAHYLSI